MRCRTCDYSLWNLPSRTCPECGSPFLPSDFEFVPNSVRFCCPHCGQDYYGTGLKGHLVPDAFACVRCGAPVRMDEMILSPTAGVDEGRTRAQLMPWLDRSNRGFIKGWFGTVGMVLAKPGILAATLPDGPVVGPALGFAFVTLTLYGLVSVALPAVFMLWSLPRTAFFPIALIAIPVAISIVLLVWSLIAHGILLMTGTTAKGFSRTLECLCYASAAAVLLAIPCLGTYLAVVAWIWCAISAAIMLATAQKVSGLRAACAAVLPPLLVTAAIVAWITLVFIPRVSRTIASIPAYIAIAQAPVATGKVGAALRSYAAANNGSAPPHSIALLADKYVFLPDVYLSGSPATPAEGTVAGIDVTFISSASPSERTTAVRRAAALLPPGTVAHRLGDMVFVYHGIDISPASTADPGLWLVICSPSPAASPPPAPPSPQSQPGTAVAPTVSVGTLGNGMASIPVTNWPAALAQQNALRAAAGLPPIPDPATVK